MTAPVLSGPLPHGGGPDPYPDWDETMADIGDRIRAERQARGWSRTELARRTGMNRTTVQQMESGSGSLLTFTRLCWALGVRMDVLLSPEWRMPVRRPVLTPRQTEVLAVVADGRPLSAAGRELGITGARVASTLSEVYRRLDVAHVPRESRRAMAVRVAARYGLIDAA